jgi:hypothetical protein
MVYICWVISSIFFIIYQTVKLQVVVNYFFMYVILFSSMRFSASINFFGGEPHLLCYCLSPLGSGLGHDSLIFLALNPHCNLSVIFKRVYSPFGIFFLGGSDFGGIHYVLVGT